MAVRTKIKQSEPRVLFSGLLQAFCVFSYAICQLSPPSPPWVDLCNPGIVGWSERCGATRQEHGVPEHGCVRLSQEGVGSSSPEEEEEVQSW